MLCKGDWGIDTGSMSTAIWTRDTFNTVIIRLGERATHGPRRPVCPFPRGRVHELTVTNHPRRCSTLSSGGPLRQDAVHMLGRPSHSSHPIPIPLPATFQFSFQALPLIPTQFHIHPKLLNASSHIPLSEKSTQGIYYSPSDIFKMKFITVVCNPNHLYSEYIEAQVSCSSSRSDTSFSFYGYPNHLRISTFSRIPNPTRYMELPSTCIESEYRISSNSTHDRTRTRVLADDTRKKRSTGRIRTE